MFRILSLIVFPILAVSTFAQVPLRVENVVRIKGQEETIIQAYGIVSGLNGTGDDPKSYSPLATAIMRQLSRSGMFSGLDPKAVSSAKNSALVRVTVTIPGTGARDGDILDCTVVSEGNAKSLLGGVLSTTMLSTALQQDENSLVYGIAQGKVTIEQASSPGVGRVVNGCRMRADFLNPYIKDGLVTLVIKPQYSHPRMALKVAEAINKDPEFDESMEPARAINSNYVVVRMPRSAYVDPMDYIVKILEAVIMDPPVAVPKVTINERAGTVAIDENVEVKPTLVTHRNFVADIEPELGPGEQGQYPRQFLDLDTDMKFRQMNGENVTNMKLKALQASLNSLRASPQEVIDVIKILHKQGAIVGEVVFVD